MMGRRRLAPGAYGEIGYTRWPSGKWMARVLWCGYDGIVRKVSRSGKTKAEARDRLRAALSELIAEEQAGEISRDSTFREISEWWMADIQREADKRVRSPGTPRLYKSWLNNHILPEIGELRCRELEGKIRRFEAIIQGVHDSLTYDSARSVRTVLSGVCGWAVRHGAMKLNPIRSVARLAKAPGEKKEVVALDDEQRSMLLDRLDHYAQQRQHDSKGRRLGTRVLVWHDLPELAEAMLATGVRISEVLALSDEDVIREDGRTIIDVDHHIIREVGKGLIRLPGRKGGEPGLRLIAPAWSVSMFTRRKLAASGPLFASASGTWLDPSNTSNRLKAALKGTDLEWVTSHVFRKTVGSDLDKAGLTASEGADQLGNSPKVYERHYRQKRPTNQKAAEALKSPRKRNVSNG